MRQLHCHNDTKGKTMTGYVKGFVKPELNKGQQSLLDLWIKEQSESEDWREPARIDKVEAYGEDEILVYATRFIQLDYQAASTTPVRHLQIMEIDRMWDSEDPYCDPHEPVRYREVYLTTVFRTFEGDEGWNTGFDGMPQPDISALHNDWV
jgi:hypothetical protein